MGLFRSFAHRLFKNFYLLTLERERKDERQREEFEKDRFVVRLLYAVIG